MGPKEFCGPKRLFNSNYQGECSLEKCHQDGRKQESKLNRDRIDVTRAKVGGTNGA